MYSSYFGFREDPFGVSPDARFFFSGSQHAEAGASLYYAIAQRRGFAVLIAPPGLGKTTVLVNLTEKLSSQARVAFFVHPRFESGSVLESVLLAMGLDPAPDVVGRHRQLHTFLLKLCREGRTCVVVFDEAQNLTAESLETIRMLSNFETPRQKLIQFVLAGQPALADLLRAPECEQILQRVNTVARLAPLAPPEVESYIAHRLLCVGASANPFSSSAVSAIASASCGVPRNINTLCFNALTRAFALGSPTVRASDIREVAATLSLHPDAAPRPVSHSDPRSRSHTDPRPPESSPRPHLPISVKPLRTSARPFFLAAAVALLALVFVGVAFVAG